MERPHYRLSIEMDCFFKSKAHESLSLVQIGLIGSGSVEEKSAKAIISNWEKQSGLRATNVSSSNGETVTKLTRGGKVETNTFSLNDLPSKMPKGL